LLLELQLSEDSCEVDLNAVQQCTKLTWLELLCKITDIHVPGTVDCLSSLVHLKHLRVLPTLQKCDLSRAALQHLQHLTHLDVSCLSAENVLQLRGLTSLQELTLWPGWNADMVFGPSSVPGLVFPPFLKKLFLPSYEAERYVEAALLRLIPSGLEELEVKCGVRGPAEGPDSFLSGLACLQSLTRLLVAPDDDLAWPPVGPAFQALTASSNLVSLEVFGVTAPVGIWPHLFPATRKLPRLTRFVWCPNVLSNVAPLPSWGAADIASMVSCCPGLREIGFWNLQPWLDVSELYKLTSLTRLHVFYDGEDNFQGAVKHLAVLSQLHKLEARLVCEHFQLSSLLPLVHLTALTHFKVAWLSGAVDDSDGDYLCCRMLEVSPPMGTTMFREPGKSAVAMMLITTHLHFQYCTAQHIAQYVHNLGPVGGLCYL
jgi:hypothetical protein